MGQPTLGEATSAAPIADSNMPVVFGTIVGVFLVRGNECLMTWGLCFQDMDVLFLILFEAVMALTVWKSGAENTRARRAIRRFWA